MIVGNQMQQEEIKKLVSAIQNRKYDRDLLLQQRVSFPYGLLNRQSLDTKLSEIQAEIGRLEKELVKMKESKSDGKNSGVISILFLAADPTDASRLRLGEEFREIQEKLKLSK